MGGKGIRQSDRIKQQGMAGVKIADNAQLAAKKKNLEGINISFKNSFAVLDNATLAGKFYKMGGDTDRLNLENFDLLQDM
jgi:hypothetical protein